MEAHEHEPSYYEVALTNRQVVTGFVILLACLFGAFLAGVWLGKGGETASAQSANAAATRTPEAGEKRLEQLSFFGDRPPGSAPPAAQPSNALPSNTQSSNTQSSNTQPSTAPSSTPPPAPRAAAPARTPERAAPTPAEVEAEKLRRTLEAEMAEHRTDLGAAVTGDAAATPAATAPAPAAGTRVKRGGKNAAPAPAAVAPTASAAAPATQPATSVGTPATSGAVWIQVYSSSNGPKAQELASQLRKSSFKVAVNEAAGTSGTTYRVRVGPYATREDADQAAGRLRREFRLDTWVTDQL